MGDFNCLRDTSLKSFPLKQIVRAPTRGEATLDKIYINNADWFSNPVIFLAIGNSDHNTTWNWNSSKWLKQKDIKSTVDWN